MDRRAGELGGGLRLGARIPGIPQRLGGEEEGELRGSPHVR